MKRIIVLFIFLLAAIVIVSCQRESDLSPDQPLLSQKENRIRKQSQGQDHHILGNSRHRTKIVQANPTRLLAVLHKFI